jgi:hypothetical protein
MQRQQPQSQALSSARQMGFCLAQASALTPPAGFGPTINVSHPNNHYSQPLSQRFSQTPTVPTSFTKFLMQQQTFAQQPQQQVSQPYHAGLGPPQFSNPGGYASNPPQYPPAAGASVPSQPFQQSTVQHPACMSWYPASSSAFAYPSAPNSTVAIDQSSIVPISGPSAKYGYQRFAGSSPAPSRESYPIPVSGVHSVARGTKTPPLGSQDPCFLSRSSLQQPTLRQSSPQIEQQPKSQKNPQRGQKQVHTTKDGSKPAVSSYKRATKPRVGLSKSTKRARARRRVQQSVELVTARVVGEGAVSIDQKSPIVSKSQTMAQRNKPPSEFSAGVLFA